MDCTTDNALATRAKRSNLAKALADPERLLHEPL